MTVNYLAHIYLSFDNKPRAVGNFIADAVKGKQYLKYPEEIQKGIQLHRAIDTFTDQHEAFKKSKQKLLSAYGHYSPVIIDIFYDHFLAKNWNKYHDESLLKFTTTFYSNLGLYNDLLPEKIIKMMPYMIEQNWLYNYQYVEGIQRVLEGMNRRTKGKSNMHLANYELLQYYADFENEFFMCFKDVTLYSKNLIETI